MPSVLPALAGLLPCQDPQMHRKRPRPPSCLGQYHSASARAKRLRQELLRLRQWEQRIQQERTGASEGQADSCDSNFTVEPSQLQCSYPSTGYRVDDAWDSTDPSVQGLLPRVAALSPRTEPSPTPYAFPHPCTRCKGDCTVTSGCKNPQPVYKPKRFQFSHVAASSGIPSTAVCSGTLAPLDEFGGADVQGTTHQDDASWSKESVDFLSGSANPLGDLAPANGSDGVSVRQPTPSHVWGVQGSEDQVVDLEGSSTQSQDHATCQGAEENPPREETSRILVACEDDLASPVTEESESEGLVSDEDQDQVDGSAENEGNSEGSEEEGEGVTMASEEASGSESDCVASMPVSLLPPTLPPSFLGVPMPQRLRLLQCFTEAAQLLGLEVRSVFLASVMLDCCWVEAGAQGGRASLVKEDLQVSALACLLHAYSSAKKMSCDRRSVHAFCAALQTGALRFPKVASMLPVRASALEQRLGLLQVLLRGSPSASPSDYVSLLKRRGACTQQTLLVSFICQLWGAGSCHLPQGILGAAACCILSGAVPFGRADGRVEGHANVNTRDHLHRHMEDLHVFLCFDVCDEAGMECGNVQGDDELNHDGNGDFVEVSVEVSV